MIINPLYADYIRAALLPQILRMTHTARRASNLYAAGLSPDEVLPTIMLSAALPMDKHTPCRNSY